MSGGGLAEGLAEGTQQRGGQPQGGQQRRRRRQASRRGVLAGARARPANQHAGSSSPLRAPRPPQPQALLSSTRAELASAQEQQAAAQAEAGSALAAKEAQLTKVSKDLLAAEDKLSKAAEGGKTCASSLKRVWSGVPILVCIHAAAGMLQALAAGVER